MSGYADLGTGVSLLTVQFVPPAPTQGPVIVFVPGLASVIDNFRGTLIRLTGNYMVRYIETREKSTSKISGEHGFSVEEIASDLTDYLNTQLPESENYVLAGYSLGATVIAEAFSALKKKPRALILIEPNAAFNFPWWLIILARVARYLYHPLKPFLKWYIRKFRVNTTDDMEMYHINCRILDSGEPVRLGLTVRALKKYNAGDHLKTISVPSLVIGASKDKFHSHDEAIDFSSLIPGCRYFDMEDNKRTHSEEAALKIEEFISDVRPDVTQ